MNQKQQKPTPELKQLLTVYGFLSNFTYFQKCTEAINLMYVN